MNTTLAYGWLSSSVLWARPAARLRATLLWAGVLAFGGGCGAEIIGGLLVEVTILAGDEAALDGRIDELVFYVGVSPDADASGFERDESAFGHTVEVSGRKLASDPYKLLIQSGGHDRDNRRGGPQESRGVARTTDGRCPGQSRSLEIIPEVCVR